MNGLQTSRHAPGMAGMLFLLAVIAGLLLMHGVQASASPTDVRGVPLMWSTTMHLPAEHGGRSAGRPCHRGDHQHPGGQMCLALLVLRSLLLFSTPLIRSVLSRTTPPSTLAAGHEHAGRSPPAPSVFRLSVLRL